MTTRSHDSLATDLAVALRERVPDVGGEEDLYRQIVAAAAISPQRRRFAPWSGTLVRRTALVLVAGLLATAVVGAGVGRTLDVEEAHGVFPVLQNGPILVAHEGKTWWLDPISGKSITAVDLPSLPAGTDAAAWSRDGRQLAIVVNGALELIDPSSGVRRVVATCVELAWECMPAGERARSFDWSPDGVTIAYTTDRGLGLVDVNTGGRTTLIEPDGGGFSSPTWSPDGRSIAFEYGVPHLSKYMGALREIQVIERDGSDRRRLSGSPELESIGFYQPTWSPDGTRIIYLGSDAWNESTGWILRVMSIELADGEPAGPPVALVDLGSAYCLGFCPSVTLAPDASSVLIDDGELVIARIDGTGRRGLGVSARPMAWRPVP